MMCESPYIKTDPLAAEIRETRELAAFLKQALENKLAILEYKAQALKELKELRCRKTG